MNNNIKWHLVTRGFIPGGATGESIHETIKILSELIKFKFVVLDDISGTSSTGLFPEIWTILNEKNFIN